MDPKNENTKKSEEKDIKKENPIASGMGGGDDFLSKLGLDLGDFEGAVTDFIAEQPTTDTDETVQSEKDGTLGFKIDDELDSAIDEEAKMFLADKHFRAGEFYEALIPALELNIRVKQGRTKRDDVLVKRQDEILFESNYQMGKKYITQAEKASGEIKVHYKIMALMHLYVAIDQRYQKGQEVKRKDITTILKTLIAGTRVGQFYMKTGPFSKIGIPAPEDNGTKAEFWSYMGTAETDKVAKELYMLLAYNYDLSYFRYQIRLANYYAEQNRVREGIRYIQIPIPFIEEDGIVFIANLKRKSPAEFDLFVNKSFKNDIKRLNDLVEKKNDFLLLETITDWRRRINNMKSDAPYGDSTVRLEYLKAFSRIVHDITKTDPNHFTNSLLSDYKNNILTNKLPLVQEFIFTHLYFSLELNDKTKGGVNIYDVDSVNFTALCYAVDECYRYHSNPEAAKKANISIDTLNMTFSKSLKKFETSLNSKGFKLIKEPKLVP